MTIDETKCLMEALEEVEERERIIKCNTIDTVLEIIDKDIDLYKQLGKPDNQHRDVINAFKDFRRSIVALKGKCMKNAQKEAIDAIIDCAVEEAVKAMEDKKE